MQCDVRTDMGPPVLIPNRNVGNVQFISYPRGLQQLESNLWLLDHTKPGPPNLTVNHIKIKAHVLNCV